MILQLAVNSLTLLDSSGSTERLPNNAQTIDPTDTDNVPDAIPLQFLGTIDTDLANVSTEQILLHGLANISGSDKDKEGGYAVRHSHTAVNEFGQTRRSNKQQTDPPKSTQNFSVYAFPCLYPYGEGGIESDREVYVGIQDHIRYNLHFWDRRFRTHPTWSFVFFSMLQKRQALMAARLQMRRKDFDIATQLFSTLTRDDIAAAAEAEANGHKVEDPKILLLRRLIHAGGTRVMGSDASRASYRSEIWSTMLSLNPPSLWVTINPTDLHDPIVQVLAGESIDMDNFRATMGPDREQRAENMAKDPYATAQFFNFLINLILEKLFGICKDGRKVISTMGVLGKVKAYYGVVEAQGRGSLHVHMLLWLANAPSSDQMQALLHTEDFRRRVAEYVDANIHADIGGLNEEAIKSMDCDTELAWSSRPNPDSPSYLADLADLERRFVRAQQVHSCKKSTCLVYRPRLRQWVCKRRAPFQLSPQTTVQSNGVVTPRRTYGYLNNWNPSILVYGACNNDIKFISNGSEARAIIWYITAYQTKKQQRGYNISALLAEALAYHFASTDYLDDLQERNRILLFRCLQILNRQMEQSGQQVMSYLLGFGDKFCSHSYTPLYWSSLAAEILRMWPNLKKSLQENVTDRARKAVEDQSNHDSDESDSESDSEAGIDNEADIDNEAETANEAVVNTKANLDEENIKENEEVVIEASPTGALVFRSQITDYKFRGDTFADMSFVRFVTDTWETTYTAPKHTSQGGKTRGAPRHERAPYLEGHPHSSTRERVRRAAGHNMLPNIVGPYLPRSDDSESYSFYCASVLSLHKPWRNISDILPPGQSWSAELDSFLRTAEPKVLDFISGAKYYYQCKDAAARETENEIATTANGPDDEMDDPQFNGAAGISHPPTEAELEEFILSQQNPRELLHGVEAANIGMNVGLFKRNAEQSWVSSASCAHVATDTDINNIASWRESMLNDVANQQTEREGDVEQIGAVVQAIASTISHDGSLAHMSGKGNVEMEVPVEEIIDPVDTSFLKKDQLRAFNMVEKHLTKTLGKRSPPQLLMQIQGEGGTGKSKVISCITELFYKKRAQNLLLKGAYTGIAASIIDGNTLHTLCHLSTRNRGLSQKTIDALRRTWKGVEYLIIDEISMVSREFLSRVSAAITAAKQADGQPRNSAAFGGVNVLITGDFHQFPPVACGPSAALYWPNCPRDSVEAQNGRKIYEQFRTVVLLQEQCRTTDPEWLDVLRHARHGTCKEHHLQTIRSLIVKRASARNGNCASDPQWQDAVLVTPRHSVRTVWNEMAAKRHCAKQGKQLFLCPAEDTVSNRPITISERWNAATKKSGKKADRGLMTQAGLPDRVELAVGMEVMVTFNVETKLDVANGARGVVQSIVLDRRESNENITSTKEVRLVYPPECVLVKLYRTKASQIPGLESGVVPIVPMERKYNLPGKADKSKQATRRQLPITAAYAFTDYRSQGQTIKRVIVDIGRPPSGGLTPFNAYVALSRSSGREAIRLLRDFDDSLFTKTPCEKLRVEDENLQKLNRETKEQWDSGMKMWD